MKEAFLILCLFFVFFIDNKAQSKAELEEQRKKTLDEIAYVDNMLKTTEKEKTESLGKLRIIGSRLNLREKVINGMREEIALLNERIALNTIAIEMMEEDLLDLKKDYSIAVVNAYKAKKVNPELSYILSASDFNQGYKRLRYLQQVTKFRRRESEIIAELRNQVEAARNRLENDLSKISDLKSKEEIQKKLLEQEKGSSQKLVKSLGTKEKQLRKDLEEKKRIAKRIELEISRIIEEERRKSIKSDLTPEQRLIGENFADNKGRLPWPVERGVITSQFGIRNHPVLKYVTEENIGIEITSSGDTEVRSVFKGEVVKVFAFSGANWTVLIRHGRYLTAYQNIIGVKVKQGDRIETKQVLGKVFSDKTGGNKAVLKFMIFEDKAKTDPEKLDPELWISKN
jgi:murein DD-endopeptidase MepM/ murein hydrolase activator NlpD